MVTLRDFVDGKADLQNSSFGIEVDKGKMPEKKKKTEKSDWKSKKDE
jgi:hypothetical protein